MSVETDDLHAPALPTMKVDSTRLRGVAHPLRLAILRVLGRRGEATASQIAVDLGESSGSTSYHLRQLEKHGFVVDVPESGTQRERYWKSAPGGWELPAELLLSPAAQASVEVVVRDHLIGTQESIVAFMNDFRRWPAPWREGSRLTRRHLDLTPTDAQRLCADLDALIARYESSDPTEQTRRVQLDYSVVPLGDPPEQS